jgi:GxxExxY protein
MENDNIISREIVDSAIAIHSALGPGLLESAYEAALAHELSSRGFQVDRQVALPLVYKGLRLEKGYRLDMLVGKRVVVEVKCIGAIHDVHVKQVLTYLRLSDLRIGLILNFRVRLMKEGIKRVVDFEKPG